MSYQKSLSSISIALCAILISLSLPAQTPSAISKPIEIRIDPGSAQLGESASDRFSKIEYLPLQTTRESAFGEISQLESSSQYYIIWDEKSNSILFFDKSGSFVRKITNTDPSLKIPFKKIDHFTISEKKDELMFNDSHSKYLFYYNLKGEFKKVEEKPFHLGTFYTSQDHFNAYFEGYDYMYLDALKVPANNLLVEKPNSKLEFYIPFDTAALDYTDLFSVDQAFYNNQNGITNFSATYNYNIYAIDSTGKVWNSFNFVMPAINTVPDDFLTNIAYKGKRMKYTTVNSEVIYAVTDFYQIADKIVFRLYGRSTNKILTYNINDGNLYSISDVNPDKTTYQLPVFAKRIYAVDRQMRLISAVSASVLFDLKAKMDAKKWTKTLPAHLKKFFSSDVQQNPVLTILTLN